MKSNKKKAIVLVVLVVWILIAISLTAYYSAKNKDAIKEVPKTEVVNPDGTLPPEEQPSVDIEETKPEVSKPASDPKAPKVFKHDVVWKLSRSPENVLHVGAYETQSRLFLFTCSQDDINTTTTRGFQFQVSSYEAKAITIDGIEFDPNIKENKAKLIDLLLSASSFEVISSEGNKYVFTSRPTEARPCTFK